MTPARELLLRIARCPVVEECLVGDETGHPCGRIVREQWPDAPAEERVARWRGDHHLPEPWAGHLDEAPLLFLGSSPALWADRPDGPRAARAPRPAWDDAEIADRFDGTFDRTAPDGVHRVAAEGAPRSPCPPGGR